MLVCTRRSHTRSEACSHTVRTTRRATVEALNRPLVNNSCNSSASKRNTVCSSTGASNNPSSASAQSTRETGSGTHTPSRHRRTASAASTGSKVHSPSGTGTGTEPSSPPRA